MLSFLTNDRSISIDKSFSLSLARALLRLLFLLLLVCVCCLTEGEKKRREDLGEFENFLLTANDYCRSLFFFPLSLLHHGQEQKKNTIDE